MIYVKIQNKILYPGDTIIRSNNPRTKMEAGKIPDTEKQHEHCGFNRNNSKLIVEYRQARPVIEGKIADVTII